MKKINFVKKSLPILGILILVTALTGGCVVPGSEEDSGSSETKIQSTKLSNESQEETTPADASENGESTESDESAETSRVSGQSEAIGMAEIYPETQEAAEAIEDESPYFGIMYATVYEVTGSGSGESVSYTLVDKNSTEESWTFNGLEIGDVGVDMSAGIDVVVLFNGDIINDSENVSFIAVLPDGAYSIQKATGAVTDNMMSTFTLTTLDGSELHFIKDNCRMDEGALDLDTAHEVTVYYAESSDIGNYPFRIYITSDEAAR